MKGVCRNVSVRFPIEGRFADWRHPGLPTTSRGTIVDRYHYDAPRSRMESPPLSDASRNPGQNRGGRPVLVPHTVPQRPSQPPECTDSGTERRSRIA